MSIATENCPPWCTTDHENADEHSVRRTVHIAAESRTSFPSGSVHASAWWSGYEHTAPDVFVSFPGDTHDRMTLDPESAYGLAELLEFLADATPDQRRQIAEQVRAAADALTKDKS